RSLGEDRRDAPERGADQHRPRPELVDDGNAVGSERGERVIAVDRPFALAVAAQIEGHRLPAVLVDHASGAPPPMASLATAVHQEDRPAVSPHVGGEMNPLESLEPVTLRLHVASWSTAG